MILATDFAKHFEYLSQLKSIASGTLRVSGGAADAAKTNDEGLADTSLVLATAIKFADVVSAHEELNRAPRDWRHSHSLVTGLRIGGAPSLRSLHLLASRPPRVLLPAPLSTPGRRRAILSSLGSSTRSGASS